MRNVKFQTKYHRKIFILDSFTSKFKARTFKTSSDLVRMIWKTSQQRSKTWQLPTGEIKILAYTNCGPFSNVLIEDKLVNLVIIKTCEGS